MTAKKEESKLIKKNKKWVSILSSKEFGAHVMGETYVDDPQKSVGNVIEINFMSVTNDPKKQSSNAKFKIVDFKDNVLNTEFIGYSLQRAQIKRLARAGKDKIDDSYAYSTKDNVKIKVKPVIITRVKCVKSKITGIRKASRSYVEDLCKKMSYSEIVKEIVSGNLVKEMRNKVNKVGPVGSLIIKSFERY